MFGPRGRFGPQKGFVEHKWYRVFTRFFSSRPNTKRKLEGDLAKHYHVRLMLLTMVRNSIPGAVYCSRNAYDSQAGVPCATLDRNIYVCDEHSYVYINLLLCYYESYNYTIVLLYSRRRHFFN